MTVKVLARKRLRRYPVKPKEKTMLNIKPPTREEKLVFQGLQKAILEDKAFIEINFRRLNRFGSPFFNPWENILPLLFFVFLFFATLFVFGMAAATVLLAFLALGYAFLMPYFLKPFMKNRVIKRIVPRIEKFLIAWRFGGFTIYLSADPNYKCRAMLDDWKSFVQTYFADLIPADSEEKENE